MFSSTGGLDYQLQAFHTQDGYAVTSCEKHFRNETLLNSFCIKNATHGGPYLQRNCFFFSRGRSWNTAQKSLMVGWPFQYSPLYSVLWRGGIQRVSSEHKTNTLWARFAWRVLPFHWILEVIMVRICSKNFLKSILLDTICTPTGFRTTGGNCHHWQPCNKLSKLLEINKAWNRIPQSRKSKMLPWLN